MKFSKQAYNYESTFSLFIQALKQKNPEMELQQHAGRALLWDKLPLSLDAQMRLNDSRLSQKAYPYQTNLK